MTPIQRAIKHVGSQGAMADAMGITQPVVSEWVRGIRQIPEGRCADIERLTAGDVTADELRPDVRWVRVRDAAWPRRRGRPCVDVAAAMTGEGQS